MMRSRSFLHFFILASTGLSSAAIAQEAKSPMMQPSIEMNQNALKALNSAPATSSSGVQTNSSQGGTLAPAAPAVRQEGTRETIITPPEGTPTYTGKPRLVWVKGPDGQQVPMKPDKPKKKRVKKPQPKPECSCPEGAGKEAEKTKAEEAKAAPVAPVNVEEKKPEPAAPAAVAKQPAAAPAPAAPAAKPEEKKAEAAASAAAAKPTTPPAPPVAAVAAKPAAPATPPAPPAPPAAAQATPPAPPVGPAKPAAPAAAPATPATSAAAAPAAPVNLSAAPAAPASAPAAADLKGPPALSLAFTATETALPLSKKADMDKLVGELKADEAKRVNLVGYASAAADQASTARRVSLSRALSVRAYLIDNGISNLRINVQAEGDKNPGGAPDRVDVFVTK